LGYRISNSRKQVTMKRASIGAQCVFINLRSFVNR